MENKDWMKGFQEEIDAPFAGWNFSRLTETGRMQEAPLSWNYSSVVRQKMKGIHSLLDMGTGGGELLGRLQPLPSQTFATEGYLPNVEVARAKLAPLGVHVIQADGEDELPLPDQSLDLIINRHESYLPSEVYRLLKPEGIFITQQVGGKDNQKLNHLLGAPIPTDYLHWNAAFAVNQLKEAGFVILEQKEEEAFTRFYDVGAIVYYLKAIEWQIPDFTIERYATELASLHHDLQAVGYVDIPTHRFLIVAQTQSNPVKK
ncbi:class I SAM-dependent methyltransferase [Brevibacillus reuszeri]|uniref:class I SAM-dependent methyltransferase n=1 Tax=Brevibacillus reuszeri TaxID=54915 RepID=UPI00289A30E6|nr:class I SAM-dependent methyltransferase [Brevibacillus reuszeri]